MRRSRASWMPQLYAAALRFARKETVGAMTRVYVKSYSGRVQSGGGLVEVRTQVFQNRLGRRAQN